jgi:uncharacterized protein
MATFGSLRSAKYMLLTTFKPEGNPVSTHVHGVVDGDRAYFRAMYQPDTANRLRHTDDVQVCPVPGLTVGPSIDAVARLLPGEEASRVAGKLARKYRLQQYFLIPLLHRARRWQMAHYELLSYEAATSQDLCQVAHGVPDPHVHVDSGRISRRHQNAINRVTSGHPAHPRAGRPGMTTCSAGWCAAACAATVWKPCRLTANRTTGAGLR